MASTLARDATYSGTLTRTVAQGPRPIWIPAVTSPIPRPRVRRVAATLAAAPALTRGTAGAPTGSTAEADTATAPAMDGTGVAGLDPSGISGTPTQIASATVLAADNAPGNRAAREVKGITPHGSRGPRIRRSPSPLPLRLLRARLASVALMSHAVPA
ncbi:hypothetical protein OG840_25330 [Streptomyces sp. NBC_01764]|uniref:hypothetical protein n=1 Tax=Streptomyces sp. NBC_01764 TaxID=2975935 RepID=UPI00225BBA16|nr:hypothetical protein [Streptomyces sp. NBC_01764]MCX4404849.1 hypothetical protein [Streptomyces sp. NBC_01764]